MNVLVLGAESSGTRFTTRWLESAGLKVIRFSLPFGPDQIGPRRWPTIDGDLDSQTFERVVVTVREPSFAVPSQMKTHPVKHREAEANVSMATLSALWWADEHHVPARLLVYEAVMSYPEAVARSLGRWLDTILPVPDVVDGDEKWAVNQ